MKNKKLFAAASLAVLVSSAPVFAKTEGNYVGLDLLRTKSNFQYTYANGSAPDPKVNDAGYGFGLNYKYAFNINNFFIAPGVFGEFNNVEAKRVDTASSYTDTFKINNRFGLKADIGYDITDNFAAYLTGGLARVGYEYKYEGISSTRKQSSSESGLFYGLGLLYNINKDIAANLEYNSQESADFKSPFSSGTDKIHASQLSVIKIGASYRF